jgi:hypothetical protein
MHSTDKPTDQDMEAAEKYADIDQPFATDTYELTNRQLEKIKIDAFKAGASHGRKAERARCAEIAEKRAMDYFTAMEGEGEPDFSKFEFASVAIRYVADRIRVGSEENK